MNLAFDAARADHYKSNQQKIRNLSEHWFCNQAYCPQCGTLRVQQYRNNQPVADFFCSRCHEDYELKSQGRPFGSKIVDGAYGTMLERLMCNSNPNLVLLRYDPSPLAVVDLCVIPKHFFVPQIIVGRKPLASTARRAGWIGCCIILHGIPQVGRIFLVRDSVVIRQQEVMAQWHKTLFLRQQGGDSRNWLLSTIGCIERLHKRSFSIDDMYRFEAELQQKFPANRHIKEKLRQQLQVLRDKGYLEFVGRGNYRLTPVSSASTSI